MSGEGAIQTGDEPRPTSLVQVAVTSDGADRSSLPATHQDVGTSHTQLPDSGVPVEDTFTTDKVSPEPLQSTTGGVPMDSLEEMEDVDLTVENHTLTYEGITCTGDEQLSTIPDIQDENNVTDMGAK